MDFCNCIVRWIHISDRQQHHASHKASVSKMENKRWTVCWLEYKKCCILCKNCMHFIYFMWRAVPSGHPRTAGILYCPLFHGRCQQCVWGLDLRQTGRQSLSSQQPTSLSGTLAAPKSIMLSLLCHFQHHGGFPSLFYSFSWAEWCLQSGQHAKRRFTYLKTLGGPSCILGEKGLLSFGGSDGGQMRDCYRDATFCVYQETVHTTVLFVPMTFLLRMLMAYSPRLVPFSSFRSGFLQTNILDKVRTNFYTWESHLSVPGHVIKTVFLDVNL